MRVLVVTPSLAGGGAEFVARKWIEALSRRGHTITVVLTHASIGDEQVRLFEGCGARTSIQLRSLQTRKTPRLIGLARLVGEARPDVVLSVMTNANILALLATAVSRQRSVVVASEHNLPSVLGRILGWRQRLQYTIARVLYRRAGAVVAASHAVGTELCAAFGVDRQRLWVVPNPAAEDALAFEHALGGRPAHGDPNDGRVSIVVPGRLVAQKRPHLALEVGVRLAQTTPMSVEVHFYGSGDLEKSLRERAQARGVDARFHGWVDHWYSDLPINSVVLLASATEGFGNVLVEAAAVGVPAVSSSRALGVIDACIPGITACLVSDDSVQAFTDGVLTAHEMPTFNVEDWLTRFTVSGVGALLERTLASAVDSNE